MGKEVLGSRIQRLRVEAGTLIGEMQEEAEKLYREEQAPALCAKVLKKFSRDIGFFHEHVYYVDDYNVLSVDREGISSFESAQDFVDLIQEYLERYKLGIATIFFYKQEKKKDEEEGKDESYYKIVVGLTQEDIDFLLKDLKMSQIQFPGIHSGRAIFSHHITARQHS